MVENIHICPVGFHPEPVLAVLGSNIPCDKFYFLYNEHKDILEALKNIKETMSRLGLNDLHEVLIDPFDYSHVVSTILKIHHDEIKRNSNAKIHINFTSGTNIVAGACCSVSYFIGATLYYVMDHNKCIDVPKSKLVREIRTPRIPDMEKMTEFAQKLLLKICDSEEGLYMKQITERMQASSQRVNHHLNSFIESGLVEKTKIGKNVHIKRTDQGKMFSTWIGKE